MSVAVDGSSSGYREAADGEDMVQECQIGPPGACGNMKPQSLADPLLTGAPRSENVVNDFLGLPADVIRLRTRTGSSRRAALGTLRSGQATKQLRGVRQGHCSASLFRVQSGFRPCRPDGAEAGVRDQYQNNLRPGMSESTSTRYAEITLVSVMLPQYSGARSAGLRAYRVQMSEIPNNGSPDPDEGPQGNEVPADAFSPVVDPDLAPDAATPEEKRARTEPEETSS